MNNQNKENSKIEDLKLNRELHQNIGKLIFLIPILIILLNVYSCSNNNYIDNPDVFETVNQTRYSEKKITERLTSYEKDFIKSFLPEKYFKTISGDFDANYPNPNGTNDIMVTIQNISFDNVDSCIDVFKTFIKNIYNYNLNKKIGEVDINYIGSKNGKYTHMIWVEDLYSKDLNEAIASIEIKSFNNDNKSGVVDGSKTKEIIKMTNEEIKQQLYTFFNNYTDNSTMVAIEENSYMGEIDWIVSLYDYKFTDMSQCQLEFSIWFKSLMSNEQLWGNINNITIGFTDTKSFACGAIVDVPLVKENGGQFAYATEWQDWTNDLKLR